MRLSHQTVSFCPTCFLEIPAKVTVTENSVLMSKTCPVHGASSGLVERDPLFYQIVRSLNSPSIYDGHFIDVTQRCNLECAFCYYPIQKADPEGEYTIDRLVNEAKVNRHRAPFIITGGEPTLRSDIAEVMAKLQEVGPIELLTNGTVLANEKKFAELMPLITQDGEASLNLSLHLKETDKWMEVVARCRSLGVKIESALIVINSRDEFLMAVELAKTLKDVVISFRIKAASLLWNEQKPQEKIFVSDMWSWLDRTGKPVQLIPQRHNKVSIVNVAYDGMWIMIVSWYDRTNIDLIDVDCAPWYRARNGEVKNFVVSCLINEGLEESWCKGKKVGK